MKLPEDKLDLIIEILRQHDKRFEQTDKRFEQIDKRFEQIEKRFEQIDKRLDQITTEIRDFKQDVRERFERNEADAREDRRKLEKIYESRKEVVVRFSRNWAWQNMLYSGGISVITVLAFLAFVK